MDNQLSTTALVVIAASGGVGALLAGLVSTWVTWQTDKRTARREHASWLREKKLAAYSEFGAVARVMDAHASVGGKSTTFDLNQTVMTFNRRYYDIQLLMDGARLASFIQQRNALTDAAPQGGTYDREKSHTALQSLMDLMREDLAATE